MSDDFDFNADDLFDDDFDDFDDDNDFGGDDLADDFGGDDFGADLDLGFMDDDDFGDDDFGDDDFADDDLDDDFGDDNLDDDSGDGGPGISRGVMMLGGAMLVILIIFLILIMFLIFGGGNSSFELTKSAIETENSQVNTQIAETEAQNVINQTGTVEAAITGTAEAIDSGTASASTQIADELTLAAATLTQSALNDIAATEAQETANAEGTASVLDLTSEAEINATQTEIFFQQTLNPQVTAPPLATTPPAEETMPVEQPTLIKSEVEQTATKLAELFSTPPTSAPVQGSTEIAAVSTEMPGATPGTTGSATTSSTSLPDTGLADDLFQAFFGDPRLAILAAFGLLGVIVVSRGVRSANRKEDDDEQ